ncbi:nucleoside-diphosphate-sugar epimerase [Corynebacterium deserti GIMN1.010]|uniref:Nucleoside-diphosphate-sugar epimerase n=1 Tax=Corynebacterium deserti GIMN1.010 TaxID=931089 RepID=A0A0M4CY06_9CORY|nr:NAD(P)H-binding protein [Corynebacterium deserti]ALC05895.1 nucleoside-diphosphate-sugar epimerase [Corynebacterium deserti GIMN1.010]
MTETTRVLLIGGHGKVALLATPLLVDAGLDVTSMFRNPDHRAEIEALGATALERDVTTLTVDDWADLLKDFDVVVWSAGNGGKNGAEATYAIDRDAAIASIDGAASLGENAPRYIMVSYIGSTSHTIDPSDSFYPYAESKKAADEHLAASNLDYLILRPSGLTLDEAHGVEIIADTPEAGQGRTTSRKLVAEVITEFSVREFPQTRVLPFVDGDTPVSEIN